MSDEDEFMEKAIGRPENSTRAYLRKVMQDEDQPSINPSKMRAGLCQYASLGDQAFLPTSNTIATLPPDCYNLSTTNNGELVFVPQKLITDDLLRLPDSKSDEVVAEVERFWHLKDKFREMGFAHKRGFLLFGPPGSGKTSTISIIVQDMIKKGGIVILCQDPGMLAKGLQQMRLIEPDRPAVVILEDLDTIIRLFGESVVLSVLDGESQVENVVFVATTNYPENLDGRIINRPSRFDKVVKIGFPNDAAREMYLKSKVKSLLVEGYDLVKETNGLSIAHIKELIISHYCQGNPIKEVLNRLQKMKYTPKSGDDRGALGI